MFQLHPNGYRFADGHVAKLELLPKDSGTAAGNSYGRTSNNQANVTVENLELRLPVLEAPDSLGGFVEDPVTKFLPPGYTIAPGYPPQGYPRPEGATPLRASLVPAYKDCTVAEQDARPAARVPVMRPPEPESSDLTVGTPDANGQAAKSIGFARYDGPARQSRHARGRGGRGRPAVAHGRPPDSELEDYTGEVQLKHCAVDGTDNAIGPAAATSRRPWSTSRSRW